MIFKSSNLVKSIYKGDQFILAVFKGTNRVFPQHGGYGHVGSYTAFNVNNMSSASGRFHNTNGNYFPVMAAAMPDWVFGIGYDYTQYNPAGYPVSYTKGAAFNARIHRCYRVYSPFAATLQTGAGNAQYSNLTGAYYFNYGPVSLNAGYTYITEVKDVDVSASTPHLFPLSFGNWSSSWIVDQISVQILER